MAQNGLLSEGGLADACLHLPAHPNAQGISGNLQLHQDAGQPNDNNNHAHNHNHNNDNNNNSNNDNGNDKQHACQPGLGACEACLSSPGSQSSKLLYSSTSCNRETGGLSY